MTGFFKRISSMKTTSPDKKTNARGILLLCGVGLALSCMTIARAHAAPLEDDFRNPPDAARPFVWWHWMGPYFSKDGITKDLEAMKASGIGGATVFNVSSYLLQGPLPPTDPWSANTYRGPAYWDALRHAAAEADRLGLELGIHNCVGYATTGGPWIDEERSMQRLVWSNVEVNGGGQIEIMLPEPDLDPGEGWGITKEKLSFFRDVAVLAVPAGQATIAPEDVKDISAHFTPSGSRLLWKAPPGKWLIYRIGHASNGHYPFPEPEDTTGRTFEVDKMSLEQSRHHWSNVLDPLKEQLGPLMGKSFKHILIDSYESGMQNWTPGFREEFMARKGYDLLPWLAAMTPTVRNSKEAGDPLRIVGSEDQTARFEWDYKDVVAQLFYERGWKVGSEMINAAGAQLHWEPYGGPFDTVEGSALADVPMGCFWTHTPKTGMNYVILAAARAAGRNILGVEAYTGMPELSSWNETLAFLKLGADCTYSTGGNRFMLHHWAHQPFDDRYQPGMGMHAWGTHFNRHQTWLAQGGDFFRYLARIQALLQRGETPVHFVSVGTAVRPGDVISKRAFLNETTVEDGRIVLPSGRRYAFIHVPHSGSLLPEEVRHIKTLLEAGAIVVARKPERSPSLAGYPASDVEVARLAAELWDTNENVRKHGPGTLYTKGDVNAALKDLKLDPAYQIFSQNSGDVRISHRKDGEADLFFVANVNEHPVDLTLSFAVQGMQPELWDAETGSMQDAPLWRPRENRTDVTLPLGAVKSVFVVFRKKIADVPDRLASIEAAPGYELLTDEQGHPVIRSATALTGTAVMVSGKRLPFELKPAPEQIVSGPWQVELAPKLGPEARLELQTLRSLTEHDDPAVKYFSGTATYRGSVSIDETRIGKGRRMQLDLGDVRDMVRVTVNGTEIAVLWHPPFVCDITAALKPGENTLELAVANTWHNRLVGDEQFPKDMSFWGEVSPWFLNNEPRPQPGRVAFTTTNYQKKDTPLIPAGLLGPLRLIPVAETQLINPGEITK